jgi:hypothetical protein
VVDTIDPAQPAPPPYHPKHYWIVPRSWSEWVGLVVILGVVAICAYLAGQASKIYDINRRELEITKLTKENQKMSEDVKRENHEKQALKDRLAATDNQLKDAFNAYRTIVLSGNDMTFVSTGHFTAGLVGPPANEKVTINVNGTQHTVAAGDSIDVGAFTCRVEVKSFDTFKVTLLTACMPMKP